MKYIAYILTPMHKELVKYFAINIMIECFPKIFRKYIIIFIDNS